MDDCNLAKTKIFSDSYTQDWRRYSTDILQTCKIIHQLKLIDRLCTTHWTPPDDWQTDNANGLVMVIRNYNWLNSASRVPISTCSTPLVQTGECKQFSLFDLDLWPTTLSDLQSQTSQDQRSNSSNRWVPTANGHSTHTEATKRIISPATRLITINSIITILW